MTKEEQEEWEIEKGRNTSLHEQKDGPACIVAKQFF